MICQNCGAEDWNEENGISVCNNCGKRMDENENPLLTRAFLLLEDGEFLRADELCERVLETEPKNGEAYLCKLLISLRVRDPEELAQLSRPFDNDPNYIKAVRFGDDALKNKLNQYHVDMKRNAARIRYDRAVSIMDKAASEQEWNDAAYWFEAAMKYVPDYKNAAELRAVCQKNCTAPQENTLADEKNDLSGNVSGEIMQGSDTADTSSYPADPDPGAWEIKPDPVPPKKKKYGLIVGASIAVIGLMAAFLGIFVGAVYPQLKYRYAQELLSQEAYTKAYEILEDLGRDNEILISKYDRGCEMIDQGEYDDAVTLLTEISGDYPLAVGKLDICYEAMAEEYLNNGDYQAAFDAYEKITDPSEAGDLYIKCCRGLGVQAYEVGDYALAVTYLEETDADPEVQTVLEECYRALAWESLDAKAYEDVLAYCEKITDETAVSELKNECNYRQGTAALENGDYLSALEYYTACHEYLDTADKIVQANYGLGCIALSDQNYEDAINYFELCGSYEDTEQKLLEAKYGHVTTDFNPKSRNTYDYFSELAAANYKDSKRLFEQSYKWKVEVYAVNHSSTDYTGNYKKFKREEAVIFHFHVTGGSSGEILKLYAQFIRPSGTEGGYEFEDIEWKDGKSGWYGWMNGLYADTQDGATGTLKLWFADPDGNIYGRSEVEIVE